MNKHAAVSKTENQNSHELYIHTLFGLFDEIFEIDFADNTFMLLSSKYRAAGSAGVRQDLRGAITNWASSFVSEKDRAALFEFMDVSNIRQVFSQGNNPTLEYMLALQDGSQKYCRSTLLQLADSRYLCCNRDISEQKKNEQLQKEILQLRTRAEEQKRYRIVVEQTGAAVIDMNYVTGAFYCSESYARYETSRHDQVEMLANAGDRSLVHPDDQSELEKFFAASRSGVSHAEAVLRVKMIDGSYRWTRMAGYYVHDEWGKLLRSIGTFIDIDDDKRAKEAMERKYMWQAEKYKILSESAEMITFDYSPPDDVMRIYLPLPGKGFSEEIKENYLQTFVSYGRIPDQEKDKFIAKLRQASQEAMRGTYDFEGDYYQTGMRWYRAKYVSLADKNGQVYRVIGRLDDINDIIREQDQLRVDAQLDEITGVYNKKYAVSAVTRVLQEKSEDSFDAVLFMDIDNFKGINDTFGHLEADEVLRQVGAILKNMFRQEDIVARFGGDEFIVYMKSAGLIANVIDKAEGILKAVHEITIGEQKPVGCSIGITSIVGAGINYEGAIKRADMALYEAKENGKNQYVVLERPGRRTKPPQA